MNRIYKVIWNKARGLYVVVSELAKAQGKSSRSNSGQKNVVLAIALTMAIFSGYGVSEAAVESQIANAPGGHVTVLSGSAQDAENLNKVIEAADTLVNSADAIKDKADQSALDQEIADRKAADAAQQQELDTHAKAIDGTLKLDENGVLQQQTYDETTKTFSDADVSAVTVKGDITASGTITGGTFHSTGDVEAENDVTAGRDVKAERDVTAGRNVAAEQDVTAGRNMKADGNISAGGNLNVTNNGTIGGNLQVNGNTNTNGTTTTGGLTVNGASTFNGTATVNGNLTAQDGTFSGDVSGKSLHSNTDITANGDISGKNINASGDLDVDGKTTTGSLEVAGDSTVGGNLEVGGTSTFKDDATFKKDVTVDGQLNVDKLHIAKDANNYTDIDGGKVTSVNSKVDLADGTVHTSVSTFDENGSNVAVNNGTTKTRSTQTADGFSESMSGNGSTDEWGYNRGVSQEKGTVRVSEEIIGKDGVTKNTAEKAPDSTTSTVTDGKGTSTFRQKIDEILAEIKAENGFSTTIDQTAQDITNTAKDGTITNDAKDLVNNASGNMTNTVGGNKTEEVTGAVKETYGSQETTVKGDQSTSVEGNQDNAVKGNQTNTVTGTKTEEVTGKVTETYSAGQDTTVTGDRNETVSGAVNEQYGSQKTDVTGDQENTVGGNQKNTVTGTKTETVTGAVTEDYKADQTTTVGGDQKTTITGDQTTTAANITNTASGALKNSADTITNEAKTSITDKVGDTSRTMTSDSITDTAGGNSVTTSADGTVFSDGAGTTTIKGDTITTGTVNANDVNVANKTTTKTLEVKENASVGKDLDVAGTTTTKELKVTESASIAKDLMVGGNTTVSGDVTASSYKVGDKTYISDSGINANDRKIVNVAPGEVSATSTDAVNGSQLYETNQRVGQVEQRATNLERKVSNLDDRVDKVGASAAAMANLHPQDFDEDSKLSIAAAAGSYRSETAGAVGLFYRPTDRVMFNISASFGNGENLVGGGVSVKLGRMSHRDKVAAENSELRSQVQQLTAWKEKTEGRMDALLSVINPNMSKDFPDVPANHWAYEAVSRLAGNDIIHGFEDGKYHGEQTMTRYQMAEIIYNALAKGAKAEAKLVEEFRPELQAMAAQKQAN